MRHFQTLSAEFALHLRIVIAPNVRMLQGCHGLLRYAATAIPRRFEQDHHILVCGVVADLIYEAIARVQAREPI
jgi:hypothetical protein